MLHIFAIESIHTLVPHILGLCVILFLVLNEVLYSQWSYLFEIAAPILLCALVYYLSFRITRRRILKLTSPPIKVSQKLISCGGFKWNKITLSNGDNYLENICYCDIHKCPYLNENGECFCPTENCKQKQLSCEDMKLLYRATSAIILKKHIANY